MNVRVLTTCLLACELLAGVRTGQAADTTANTPGIADGASVVVLGIGRLKKSARPDEPLDLDSTARTIVLGRLGELYPKATTSCAGGDISHKDQSCRDISCWQGIAQRCGAYRIVVGDFSEQDDIYTARLVLVNQDGLSIKRERGDCINCSDEQKAETLKTVLGTLFASSRPSVSTVPTVAPEKPLPGGSLPICRDYYSFGRGVAIGASSYMLAAGLAASVAYSAMDDHIFFRNTDSAGVTTVKAYDFGPKQAIGYSLSALPLAGLVASLLANRPQGRLVAMTPSNQPGSSPGSDDPTTYCQAAASSKKTFGRGFALGTLGAAAVSGLVAAAVLGGLHGKPIDADMTYRSTYDFVTPAAASGVVSGLSVVGFLLAWPW